jgi:hypothetical protein
LRGWIALFSLILLILQSPIAAQNQPPGPNQAPSPPPGVGSKQGPPSAPPIDTEGGGPPAPAPGGSAPTGGSSWGYLTSPLYSVAWATSEVPWFPVGLLAAALLGYYVGSRKGPSPWEEE